MRNVQVFLSLEHLEAILGLLIDVIFIIVITQGIGSPKLRERNMERLVSGAVGTHNTYPLSSLSYTGTACGASVTVATPKITDHRSP